MPGDDYKAERQGCTVKENWILSAVTPCLYQLERNREMGITLGCNAHLIWCLNSPACLWGREETLQIHEGQDSREGSVVSLPGGHCSPGPAPGRGFEKPNPIPALPPSSAAEGKRNRGGFYLSGTEGKPALRQKRALELQASTSSAAWCWPREGRQGGKGTCLIIHRIALKKKKN